MSDNNNFGNSNNPNLNVPAAVAPVQAPLVVQQQPQQNAFEWLAGGLFFGGSSQNSAQRSNKRALQNIESTKDVKQLWNGVEENFFQILQEKQQQELQAAAAAAAASGGTEDVIMANTSNINYNSMMAENRTVAVAPEEPPLTASDFFTARLTRLRFLLYEERKSTSSGHSNFRLSSTPHVAVASVSYFTQKLDRLPAFLQHLQSLPFESRKVITHIICYLGVAGLDGPDAEYYREPVTLMFCNHVVLPQVNDIFGNLLGGYYRNTDNSSKSSDICLHCGNIYRSLLRHAVIYRQLVGTSQTVAHFVFPFLDSVVQSPNFDVASDAMECLRVVLTPPTAQQEMVDMAAEFMTRDYEPLWDDRFVPKLLFDSDDNKEISNNSYMTKRVALQILSTVLLRRSNYNVMVRFVASARNLKVVLLLLRHTSPHITLDAFHVFKVFVANPNKPPEVTKILKDNQVKLCAYLQTLHPEKAQSDAQFRDEKALIIATIEAL